MTSKGFSKKDIAVVGDESFTLGFRLAGIREIYNPENDQQMDKKLKELSETDEIGIVVIPQESVKNLSTKTKNIVRDSIDPIFVKLTEKGTEGEDLREKTKRAIGVDLWQ